MIDVQLCILGLPPLEGFVFELFMASFHLVHFGVLIPKKKPNHNIFALV